MRQYWIEVPGWGSHGVMARDADEARQRAAGEAHRRGATHAVLTLGDGSTVSVDAAPCDLPRVATEPDRTDEERDARIVAMGAWDSMGEPIPEVDGMAVSPAQLLSPDGGHLRR